MTQNNTNTPSVGNKVSKWVYSLVVFFLVFSGFGQMPLFKRYYLADIPGLNWVADFYITHYIHYVAAILFLGFLLYKTTDYFLMFRKSHLLTLSGYIRAAWIAGIVLSGACLVINNLTGYWFSAGFIIFLDLAHIGFMLLLFITAVYCKFTKKRWVAAR